MACKILRSKFANCFFKKGKVFRKVLNQAIRLPDEKIKWNLPRVDHIFSCVDEIKLWLDRLLVFPFQQKN